MINVNRIALFRSTAWLDEHTFETIFSEQYAKVFAILYRLTGDQAEADDLAAETFWRLWDRPPRQNENIAGWLYRVATRLGYNHLRDHQRRIRYEETAFHLDDDTGNKANAHLFNDPEQATEQRQERETVRTILRQMPMHDVQVLILRHSGFSYQEIAETLKVAVSSVGTLISRAEKKFEALYRKGEEDASKS
jgi:RNA polymerase sigma factor (sigma-70 family)